MRWARYSRKVFIRERSPATAPDATVAAATPSCGGSGTSRNSGTEKISHQTATVTNDRRTASAAPARPNACGQSVIATFTANSSPPPM